MLSSRTHKSLCESPPQEQRQRKEVTRRALQGPSGGVRTAACGTNPDGNSSGTCSEVVVTLTG